MENSKRKKIVEDIELEIVQIPEGYRRKDSGIIAVGDKIWNNEDNSWDDFLLVALVLPTINLGMKIEDLSPAVMIIELLDKD